MCAVPEFNSDLLLSRHWQVSIVFFDILYHKFKVSCTKSPVTRERLLKPVLHYHPCHLPNSRLTICILSSGFYLPRTAGCGCIVRKTLKTHNTHHFIALGVILASYILTPICVSFVKKSMK